MVPILKRAGKCLLCTNVIKHHQQTPSQTPATTIKITQMDSLCVCVLQKATLEGGYYKNGSA